MKIKGSKRVPKKLEGYVLAIKASNPNWSANQVWQHLKREANGNSVIPKLRKIQKILAEGKPDISRVIAQGLDIPWSLDMTPDLSPDAIAAIFEVQHWLDKSQDSSHVRSISGWTEMMTNGKMSSPTFLTVREAQWISKLYRVQYNLTPPEMLYQKIHNSPITDRRQLAENPSKLWDAAKTYADYQRLCDLVKIDFNTSKLDEALRSGSIGNAKYNLFLEYKSKGR